VFLNKIQISSGDFSFNLRNSLLGVGLALTSGALPFAIWNLKGYIDTIPKELEEAASLDGASPTQTFLRIMLPLATPALAVTAFLGFLTGWTEFVMSWQFADKYAAGVEGTLSLSRETTDGVSDYWSAVLPVPTSRLRYFFELTDNSGETRFFNEHGFHDKRPARKHHAGHFFYPYDLPIDRFAVPSWIAG